MKATAKIIILISFLFNLPVKGFQVDDLMTQGNEFYKNEEYQKAAEKYESILAQDYESVSLYYNLGNTYFRMGKIGPAILNYERGLELDPGDEDILYNLAIVRARTVDRIQEVPQIFLLDWWNSIVSLFPVSVWMYLCFIFYLLFLTFLTLFLFSKKTGIKKTLLLSGSAFFILLLFSVTFLIAQFQRERGTNYGIIMDSVVTVKTAPDVKAGDAFVLHEGLKFEILDRLDEWVKIGLSDGKIGWLPENSFESI